MHVAGHSSMISYFRCPALLSNLLNIPLVCSQRPAFRWSPQACDNQCYIYSLVAGHASTANWLASRVQIYAPLVLAQLRFCKRDLETAQLQTSCS